MDDLKEIKQWRKKATPYIYALEPRMLFDGVSIIPPENIDHPIAAPKIISVIDSNSLQQISNGDIVIDDRPIVRVDIHDTQILAGNILKIYNGQDANAALSQDFIVSEADIQNGFADIRVNSMPPSLGTKIEEGKPLMELQSLELEQKINISKNYLFTLNKQFNAAGFDRETLEQRSVLMEQLKTVQEELNGLDEEKKRLKPIAPFSGEIVDIDPDLFLNEWLPKNTHVMSMIDPKHWIVDCYITESDLKRIDLKNIGWFEPDSQGIPNYKLTVISIDRDASKTLNEGSLASVSGGDMLVRSQNNKLIPENAIYHVRLSVDHLSERISTGYLRGHVVILAWPKSLMGDLTKKAFANLIREASF